MQWSISYKAEKGSCCDMFRSLVRLQELENYMAKLCEANNEVIFPVSFPFLSRVFGCLLLKIGKLRQSTQTDTAQSRTTLHDELKSRGGNSP
jgi:hypothetical protein